MRIVYVYLLTCLFLRMEKGLGETEKNQRARPATEKNQSPLSPSQAQQDTFKEMEITSSLTSRLFRIVRPAVFQIKTSLAANSPKASYGSGFVISKKGILVTNYHVIHSALQDKEDNYKIFLVSKGQSIEAKIIGVDSTRDLALIKVDRLFKTSLKMATTPMKKGEKIYSVGLPKDLNISISEGNYNGTIKYGVYEQIHMSSPINSGMSGGPTVNRRGEVVGVNVSVLMNSQNISFSVPAKFINVLLKNLDSEMDAKKNIDRIIENQLIMVQDSLIEDMKRNMSKVNHIDQWKIAPPSKSLKCWSSYKNESKSSYKINHQLCSLKANSYIKDSFYSGDYEIHYASVRNKRRNGLQFFSLLNYLYNNNSNLENGQNEDSRSLLTQFDCSEKIVVNSQKITFKVNFCIQGYVKYPQLYSANFKAVTLGKNKNTLIMKAVLRGFQAKNIKDFIYYHLSQVEYEQENEKKNSQRPMMKEL